MDRNALHQQSRHSLPLYERCSPVLQHLSGVLSIMVKITLILLFACLLNSCFVNRALNYPFRGREIIASFSIDPNTSEVQTFELDGVRTEKKHGRNRCYHTNVGGQVEEICNKFKGPYQISLCIEDSLEYYRYFEYYGDFESYRKNGVNIIATLNTAGVEKKWSSGYLIGTGVACNKLRGWQLMYAQLPLDFDVNQKVTISIQILEDRKKYLSSLKSLKLVFSAGEHWFSK